MTTEKNLSKLEQKLMTTVLAGVCLLVLGDVLIDLKDGGSVQHLMVELAIALGCIFGLFLLLRNSFRTRSALLQTQKNLEQVQIEAAQWKKESQKYITGLSQAIDSQLIRWELSPSEKEVALLLLKGLSLKEIAVLRGTTEKTARAQSTAIYQKSGLAGRSELAAFFLEDLLVEPS